MLFFSGVRHTDESDRHLEDLQQDDIMETHQRPVEDSSDRDTNTSTASTTSARSPIIPSDHDSDNSDWTDQSSIDSRSCDHSEDVTVSPACTPGDSDDDYSD